MALAPVSRRCLFTKQFSLLYTEYNSISGRRYLSGRKLLLLRAPLFPSSPVLLIQVNRCPFISFLFIPLLALHVRNPALY